MIKTLLLSVALLVSTPAFAVSQGGPSCRQFTNYEDYMRCVQNQQVGEFLGDDDGDVDYACLIDPRKCY